MTVTPPLEAPPEASVVRRAPRWMWIVLVLSVAINLVIAGMAIAAMLHFRKGGHGGSMSRFARYVDTLPEQRRSKLRDMLDSHRSRIRPLRRRLRKARRAARDAFKAEPYAREDLAKAYADVAEARIALTKARQALFPNLAELLTVEERREFLRRRHHRRRHRW
ncbi:MAG: periplasmic heavy metal sensor [Hyphomicrobiaceae bacterium]